MFKTLKNIVSHDMCRICLADRPIGSINIFEPKPINGENYTPIFIKIMCCAAVQIKNDDEFPKSICQSCSSTLDEMCKFRELIEFSDFKLRKLETDGRTNSISLLPADEQKPQNDTSIHSEHDVESLVQDVDEYRSGDLTPDEDDKPVKKLRRRGRTNPQHVPDIYICTTCDKVFRTSASLKAHQRVCISDECKIKFSELLETLI